MENGWQKSVQRGTAELLGNDGPVWYRGYAQGDESEVCVGLRRTLQGARVFLRQFSCPRANYDVLHFRIRGARASGLFQGSLTARAVAPPAAAAAR